MNQLDVLSVHIVRELRHFVYHISRHHRTTLITFNQVICQTISVTTWRVGQFPRTLCSVPIPAPSIPSTAQLSARAREVTGRLMP